jgi:hypothetical protein
MSMAVLTVVALGLSSCGGGDDDDAEATATTVSVTVAPTTTAAPTTTVPPATTTTLALVTEGATLIVANASGIDGAAGRMSDELEIAGFSMSTPTNSSEEQLETSKVYFDPENPDAEAVADSVRLALGGGEIEVLELGVPAPVESGEIGDATIVVAMGNDIADKSLAELQGRVAPASEEAPTETSAPETSAPETSAPETSAPETSAPETSVPEDG